MNIDENWTIDRRNYPTDLHIERSRTSDMICRHLAGQGWSGDPLPAEAWLWPFPRALDDAGVCLDV
jgi:hypothetical protein